MAEDDKPQLIQPPNPLKMKVGVGGPGAVTPEALERAETVITELADDYLDWVEGDLARLQAALENLKAAKGDNSGELQAIFEIAHDIKGQGGSFGYQMMTQIGDHLCRFLETLETAKPAEIDVIEVHADALRLVITDGMKGDGGAAGTALFKGLEQVVAKVSG
jgi:chemotaxis protein histidine kinase CheA